MKFTTKTKFMAITLSLVLISTLIPLTALADEGNNKKIGGNNANQKYSKLTKEISTVDFHVDKPEIKGKSGMVYIENNGQVIFDKNGDETYDPLSITKLMTVLITMKKIDEGRFDLETKFKTSKEDTKVEDSKLNLMEGEETKVKNLIYETLLYSANDAAATLGTNISGNKKKFAELMNQTAKELGCTNTKFTNANGLIENGNHSTAHDLLLIANACFKYEFVKKVCQTQEYVLPATNKYKDTIKIKTTNPFYSEAKGKDKPYLTYKIIGGKTGTWDENNASLLELSEYRGRHIYTVVLGDFYKERDPDTKKLIIFARKVIDQQERFESAATSEIERVKETNQKQGRIEKKLSILPTYKKIIKDINGVGRKTTAKIIEARYVKGAGNIVKWKSVGNALSYKIYRTDNTGDGTYKQIANVSKTNKYVDSNIEPNKIYSYYIQVDYGNMVKFFLNAWYY